MEFLDCDELGTEDYITEEYATIWLDVPEHGSRTNFYCLCSWNGKSSSHPDYSTSNNVLFTDLKSCVSNKPEF
eukprot:Pgem_evm2s17142